MGPRYLALIRGGTSQAGTIDRVHLSKAATSAGLATLVENDRLLLFAEKGASSISLAPGDAVVLGSVFARGQAERISRLSPETQKAVQASRGAALIAQFWGAYVAILGNGEDGDVHVVRDPSGAMPCYYLHRHGTTIIASDIEILLICALIHPQIDWNSVAGHLLANNLRPARTGLVDVSELLGGFRLTVTDGSIELTQIWSPWAFADRAEQMRDEPAAIDGVFATTQLCIAGWASLFDHVLLGVSGGLDSSIVAACLAESGTPFSCFTLATESPAGDERAYARILASAYGVRLFEEFEDIALVDIRRSDAAHLPRPVARSFAQSGDQKALNIAKSVGADAFFSGGGGDNVFCYLESAAPIADRLLVDGIGRGSWQTIQDVCALTECSAWTAAKQAVRRTWFRKPNYRWPVNAAFLSDKAVQMAAGVLRHPWLDAPDNALPGKATHVAWLLGIQNHLEGFGRERVHSMLAPLMSQPLVELCLQIPSWMWCSGGRNRSIARQAFAKAMPQEIVNRSSKGSPTGFVMEVFEANRGIMREMLLNGLLVDQGLLDREALAAVLDNVRPVRESEYARIMTLVDVEAWARVWSSAPIFQSCVRTGRIIHSA